MEDTQYVEFHTLSMSFTVSTFLNKAKRYVRKLFAMHATHSQPFATSVSKKKIKGNP